MRWIFRGGLLVIVLSLSGFIYMLVFSDIHDSSSIPTELGIIYTSSPLIKTAEPDAMNESDVSTPYIVGTTSDTPVGQLFAAGGLQALNDTRASHAAGEANASFETAEARAAAAESAKQDAEGHLAASVSAAAEAEARAAFAEAARAAAETGKADAEAAMAEAKVNFEAAERRTAAAEAAAVDAEYRLSASVSAEAEAEARAAFAEAARVAAETGKADAEAAMAEAEAVKDASEAAVVAADLRATAADAAKETTIFLGASSSASESGGLQALNDTRDSLLASDAEGDSGCTGDRDALEIETFDPLDLVVDTLKNEASGEGVGKGPGIATAIPGSPVNSSGETWLEEPSDNSESLRQLPAPWSNHAFASPVVVVNRTDVDVTLVTHTTVERLAHVKDIARRWPGPIIVTVVVDAREEALLDAELKLWAVAFPHVHILFRTAGTDEALEDYPVNELRNLGLAAVSTSHFLFTDVDLWPDKDLYNRIRGLPLEQLKRNDLGIVVPAFQRSTDGCCTKFPPAKVALRITEQELTDVGVSDEQADLLVSELRRSFGYTELLSCECDSFPSESFDHAVPVPSTFAELRDCLNKDLCHSFQGPDNPTGHSSTNYGAWWNDSVAEEETFGSSSLTGKLRHLECFESIRYEPYLVLRASAKVPFFQELFTGYGKNKIQYIMHLRYAGFSFEVISRSFLVHRPHTKSEAKKHWAENKKRVDKLYTQLRDVLQRIFGEPKVHLCGGKTESPVSTASTPPRLRGAYPDLWQIASKNHMGNL